MSVQALKIEGSAAKALTKTALGLTAAAMLASLGAAPAAAQECPAVKYRLWQQHQEVWYEHGETVEIVEGEEAHLYFHVRSRSKNPYGTHAEIGYPADYGFNIKSKDVRRHVRMKPQNDKDRTSGRLRFTAEEAGSTHLGYRLIDIKEPGKLDDVRKRCHVGSVPVRVISSAPERPVDRPQTTRSASRELVEVLYRSFLRRERHGEDPKSFVDLVRRQGRRGLEDVAETMTTSEEFRYEALDRIERDRRTRGREDLADLREDLLYDMYRDLYGNLDPSEREVDEDLEDLDLCLSSERDARDACARLGRNLVSHRLFQERHRDLLDDLEARDFNRRDRGDRRDRGRTRY